MAPATPDSKQLRDAFSAEVKRATRTTALAGGLIAIVAFPAWAGFDHLVAPDHGAEFTTIRLLLEPAAVALDNALILKNAEALSVTDDLTHLYNSRYLDMVLRKETKRASRSGRVAYQFARDWAGRHSKRK